jgi:hypothetical protein
VTKKTLQVSCYLAFVSSLTLIVGLLQVFAGVHS